MSNVSLDCAKNKGADMTLGGQAVGLAAQMRQILGEQGEVMTTQRSAWKWGWRHVRGSWDRDRERWLVDDLGEKGAKVSRIYVNQLIRENEVGYAVWSKRQDRARQVVYRGSAVIEVVCIPSALGLGIAAGAIDGFYLLVAGSMLQGIALLFDAIRTKNRRWTPRWPDSGYVSRTLAGTSMENLSGPGVTNR